MSDSVKLTKFTTLKGWGSKLSQKILNSLISKVYNTSDNQNKINDDSIGKLSLKNN